MFETLIISYICQRSKSDIADLRRLPDEGEEKEEAGSGSALAPKSRGLVS